MFLDNNFPDYFPGHCSIQEVLTVVPRLELSEQLRTGEMRQALSVSDSSTLTVTNLPWPGLASPPQRVLGEGGAGLAGLVVGVEAGPVVAAGLPGVAVQLGQLQHLLVNRMEDVRPPNHQLLLPLSCRHLLLSPGG